MTMIIVFAVIGLVVGGAVGEAGGALGGAALGYLIGFHLAYRKRVAALEEEVGRLASRQELRAEPQAPATPWQRQSAPPEPQVPRETATAAVAPRAFTPAAQRPMFEASDSSVPTNESAAIGEPASVHAPGVRITRAPLRETREL